jgi:sigma-E factor negative regulatory protein RseB
MSLVALAASAQSGGNAGRGAPAPEAPADARAWLMRSHEAASRRNYQGVLVMSVGAQVSSSKVAHYAEGAVQAERIDALDGEARGMLRLNDTVHTLWPRARVAVVEQRDGRASFPALLSGPERRVLEWYELRPLGQDRVAGHDADVVLLKARDPWRFSQRLWAERQTGLLLRADILAPNGQVLESSGFSELALGVKPQIEAIHAMLRHLDGYRVIRPVVTAVSLEGEGWQLLNLPAGFKEVSCARRSLDPAGGSQAQVVLQAIFSDGLTHVSLFIEPFQIEKHQGLVGTAVGATNTLMTRRDGDWITVMGDVPMATLHRFVEVMERRR